LLVSTPSALVRVPFFETFRQIDNIQILMKRPDPYRVYTILSFAVGFRIGVRLGRSGCETAAAGLPPLQRTGGGARLIRVGAIRDAQRRGGKLQLPFKIVGATPRQTSEFSENSEVYVEVARWDRPSLRLHPPGIAAGGVLVLALVFIRWARKGEINLALQRKVNPGLVPGRFEKMLAPQVKFCRCRASILPARMCDALFLVESMVVVKIDLLVPSLYHSTEVRRTYIAAGSDNSYLVLTVCASVCAIIFDHERRIERTRPR
jgi:hypothetical protein